MPLAPTYDPKKYEDSVYADWMEARVGSPEVQESEQGGTPPAPLNSTPTGFASSGPGRGEMSTGQFDSDRGSEDNLSPFQGGVGGGTLGGYSSTYTILMPPPNLTGELHAGHAFQHYLMDTLTRIHRQKGEKSLWYPGVDHAGIQMEGVLGKLLKEQGKSRSDLTDEEFLDFAWEKANEWRNRQQEQASILGDTPDYERQLFTLDDRATNMVNYAFRKYWEDGLIYKGSYLINWSVGLQTALSDVAGEIEYEKRVDPFVTFEYRVENTPQSTPPTPLNSTPIGFASGDPGRGEAGAGQFAGDQASEDSLSPFQGGAGGGISGGISGALVQKLQDHFFQNPLLVSTVRPETVFGDVAVAIHPFKLRERLTGVFDEAQIERIIKQIQSGEIVLEFGIEPLGVSGVKLIVAEEVDPEFGTGALKITPASDMHDYEIFNKYLGGDFPQAVGRDGKLTEVCGRFAGLSVEEGRVAVLEVLLENGFVPEKSQSD